MCIRDSVTSLALALTWTPTLSHYFIRSRGRRRRSEELDEAPSRGMRVYGTVLRFTLEHRLALALFTVVLLSLIHICHRTTGARRRDGALRRHQGADSGGAAPARRRG